MGYHTHCPDRCEHPQPITLTDGREVCGRCLLKFGEVVEMVLCTPEICGEPKAAMSNDDIKAICNEWRHDRVETLLDMLLMDLLPKATDVDGNPMTQEAALQKFFAGLRCTEKAIELVTGVQP